ncbi:hypothetical protein DFH08DRAFT_1031222 [Mycena albidolilacea]|uniref:Uncharacterized protein n=1 Tax=Mycena albidolilacea TaxID=1033008 RepID=A0AAD7AJH1_9AGAR|nr:hypothetical protein DFH08DRAFT_1031222 [Mycena albidolilacea]
MIVVSPNWDAWVDVRCHRLITFFRILSASTGAKAPKPRKLQLIGTNDVDDTAFAIRGCQLYAPKSPPLLDFIYHLRTSNDVPLDSQTPFVRDIISDGQNQIQALNSQISYLEAAVPQLTQRRDGIAEDVRQHRTILSPRIDLPGILAICADSGDTLIRSSNVPLSICWSAFKDGDTTDPRSRDLILTHCTRWGELLLDMLYNDAQLDRLYAAKGRLVALETLDVFRGGFGESDLDLGDIFSTAPSLRKVFLTDWLLNSLLQRPHFHERKSFTTVGILEATPNLLSCAIGFPRESNFNQAGIPIVLRRLCIEMAGFLHRLDPPLLQELFCCHSRSFDGRAEILPFVQKSSCSLKTLVLTNCSIDADLLTVLRGLPSLTHLLLEDSQASQQTYSPGQITLFDAMADDLCPNLTFLMYGFGSQFDEHHFFAMAQTRFRLDPPRPRSIQLRLFGDDAWRRV